MVALSDFQTFRSFLQTARARNTSLSRGRLMTSQETKFHYHLELESELQNQDCLKKHQKIWIFSTLF